MNTEIFYQLKGTMFRSKKTETDLIEIDEIFKDNSPVLAREKAFDRYQSYIDVFLQSRYKEYNSHKESLKELKDFINSYKREFVKIGNEIIDEINVDFDKGLCIYLVKSDKTFVTQEGETIYEDKTLIHYIDNGFVDFVNIVLANLIEEYSIYESNKFDYKHYRVEINKNDRNGQSKINTILKTPIEF